MVTHGGSRLPLAFKVAQLFKLSIEEIFDPQ
jgi:DNA-binding XRE family transcriptional regulator